MLGELNHNMKYYIITFVLIAVFGTWGLAINIPMLEPTIETTPSISYEEDGHFGFNDMDVEIIDQKKSTSEEISENTNSIFKGTREIKNTNSVSSFTEYQEFDGPVNLFMEKTLPGAHKINPLAPLYDENDPEDKKFMKIVKGLNYTSIQDDEYWNLFLESMNQRSIKQGSNETLSFEESQMFRDAIKYNFPDPNRNYYESVMIMPIPPLGVIETQPIPEGISDWKGTSDGMLGINFDNCSKTEDSVITHDDEIPICHLPDGTSYQVHE